MMRRRILIAGGTLCLLGLGFLLAFHRSYSPGPLSKGHQAFGSNCAACHEAWQGTPIASTKCIACHDGLGGNPHRDAALSDKSSGVIASKSVHGFHDRLACLSCHTDHRGQMVDVSASAGTNCSWCHQHDSIPGVSLHGKHPMVRPYGSRHAFKRAFSHEEHLQLLVKRDSTIKNLPCLSCHLAQPVDTTASRFVLVWKGCAGSGCHLNPQDQYLELPESIGAAPVTIAYWQLVSIKHINAVFEHTPPVLRIPCAQCHLRMEHSTRAGDLPSRQILNCFSCHEHQPGAVPAGTVVGVGKRGFGVDAAALAAEPQAQRAIVECTDCHAFHIHGEKPDRDFTRTPPTVPPDGEPGLKLAAYAVSWGSRGNTGFPRLELRRVILTPWWLGLLGLVVAGTGVLVYWRYLPAEMAIGRVAGTVGPQRITEVPRLDDTYQSNVRGLYVVGETGGTASINLAMRSGRQAVDFIASALKFEQAPVDPQLYDVAIIGCGPAGISAATTAKSMGLKYVALERQTAANTIRSYPRGKFVQATPIEIAEFGAFYMEKDNSKEGLVKRWEEMLTQTAVEIIDHEEVSAIAKRSGCFEVATASGKSFRARYAVLAIGVRGSPRHLGVPGETPERVFYNLADPGEFKDKRILVVGGGNAGCEVAQALAKPELRNMVSYSFRDVALAPPVTRENAEKIAALQQRELLTLYPLSQLTEIKSGKVTLAPRQFKGGPQLTAGPRAVILTGPVEIDNDYVFAMLGADLPTKFLKSIGITMIRKG